MTRPAFGASTDVGRVRATNEDRFIAHPPLFLVADGMGGQNAGEIAASITADLLEARAADGSLRTVAELAEAVGRANSVVWEQSGRDRDLQGMGSTCTAVLVTDNRLLVAHVGDSRAYLLRGEELRQLTIDHTLMQRLIDEGRLRPEDAATHPQRSVIVRAIGAAADIVPDRLTVELAPGDRLLLCSDGLSSLVPTGDIATALAGSPDPQAAAERLVALANEAGGVDNITAVVIDPDRVDAAGAVRPRPPSGRAPADRQWGRPRRVVGALLLAMALGIAVLAAAVVLAPATMPVATPATPAPSSATPVSSPASPSPSGAPSPGASLASPSDLIPAPSPINRPSS